MKTREQFEKDAFDSIFFEKKKNHHLFATKTPYVLPDFENGWTAYGKDARKLSEMLNIPMTTVTVEHGTQRENVEKVNMNNAQLRSAQEMIQETGGRIKLTEVMPERMLQMERLVMAWDEKDAVAIANDRQQWVKNVLPEKENGIIFAEDREAKRLTAVNTDAVAVAKAMDVPLQTKNIANKDGGRQYVPYVTIHFGEEDRKTTLQEVAQRTGKEVVVAPEVTQNAIKKVMPLQEISHTERQEGIQWAFDSIRFEKERNHHTNATKTTYYTNSPIDNSYMAFGKDAEKLARLLNRNTELVTVDTKEGKRTIPMITIDRNEAVRTGKNLENKGERSVFKELVPQKFMHGYTVEMAQPAVDYKAQMIDSQAWVKKNMPESKERVNLSIVPTDPHTFMVFGKDAERMSKVLEMTPLMSVLKKDQNGEERKINFATASWETEEQRQEIMQKLSINGKTPNIIPMISQKAIQRDLDVFYSPEKFALYENAFSNRMEDVSVYKQKNGSYAIRATIDGETHNSNLTMQDVKALDNGYATKRQMAMKHFLHENTPSQERNRRLGM